MNANSPHLAQSQAVAETHLRNLSEENPAASARTLKQRTMAGANRVFVRNSGPARENEKHTKMIELLEDTVDVARELYIIDRAAAALAAQSASAPMEH